MARSRLELTLSRQAAAESFIFSPVSANNSMTTLHTGSEGSWDSEIACCSCLARYVRRWRGWRERLLNTQRAFRVVKRSATKS